MKIWRSYQKGDDKIIAFLNNTIYRGNPSPGDIENVINNFHIQVPPVENFTDIPLHYLKQINLEEGQNYIEVLFGKDSSEHLRIKDQEKRKEIFDYFKTHIPNSKFYIDKYSKIRAGKKPLIAMAVVLGLFLWTFYIAMGMENGDQYRVTGDHYNSVAGIVVGLASLGTKYVSLLFATLFGIASFAFVRKTKNPKTVNRIQVRF